MNASVGAVRDQGVIDREHLRLLAIFHLVAAGMAFCGLLVVGGHYAIMQAVFNNPEAWGNATSQGPSPAQFMSIMRWGYAFFALWFGGSGVVNLMSGFFLRAHRHRMFSVVVAAFNCIHMPLGTILGVFTLIVLVRDSTKQLYETSTRGF